VTHKTLKIMDSSKNTPWRVLVSCGWVPESPFRWRNENHPTLEIRTGDRYFRVYRHDQTNGGFSEWDGIENFEDWLIATCEKWEWKPKKSKKTEQEAHEILIGKGFEWNEVHKDWRKKELQIWHGDDGYYFAKFHNHNIPVRLPSMPFASWVESVEKMTAERENAEEDDQEDPFSELIENLERLKNGILENDRQDRIELLKLAVQMATEHSKTNTVWDFGAATETFYKQLCKLAGMDEPQAQTVESDAPDTPKAPQAGIQDPRKVLVENGWTSKDHPFVDLYEKGGIECWWSGDIWIITIGDKNVRWDGTAANLAELTAKPEQPAAEQEKPEPNAIYNNAAKVENAKDTLPLRPTEVIEKAGWSWDAYGQVYRKDNCKWEVSLLPFWSMIACRCDGKEITHWTFWKPQGSKSFVEWLKEFDN